MDIYIIEVGNAEKVSEETLKWYQKKEITIIGFAEKAFVSW